KSHIERELLSRLDGVATAFDGGAGCGRFSIWLARRGLRVTHFDISQPMIDRAHRDAERAGVLDKMEFVRGSLEDLSAFADGQFDMALSVDAPLSYTYPDHGRALGELVRIAKKRLVVGVYSRIGWTPYLFNPAQKAQYILDAESADPLARWTLDHAVHQVAGFRPDMAAVRAAFAKGLMEEPSATAAAYDRGETPWPVSYGFLPGELQDMLSRLGATDIRLSGPGALSRSIPREVLATIMGDGALRADFLDFSYQYDSQIWCAGMGKDNLVASARLD
ncbi:MAG: methyltransferase domain-containing protein, partial [Clostridiales bacterium]|nr:methyltransferase domain-containing protein [Clostridiales bacterium]